MGKNLPNVYVVPINKKIINNKEIFKSFEKNDIESETDSKNIEQKINDIFSASNHVYKSKVIIYTKDSEKVIDMVGLTKGSIVTLLGDLIPITSILDIKKV